jgi:hypothetical protein
MTFRPVLTRTLRFATAAALLLGPVVTPAAKAPKPPTDLTGDWFGTFKAGHDTGTVFLTFSQTVASGTFTGTATPDSGGTFTVSGNYVMNGRKIASGDALVDDGGGATPNTVKGKASETGTELKLTFKSVDGKAKVTLSPD